MEARNIVILFLVGVLGLLGHTYYKQNNRTPIKKVACEHEARKEVGALESIKTASYPKLDRKMFKAETAVRNTLQDHETGLKVMNISNTDTRDNQIRKVVNAKSREWHGDSIAPFCNYVSRINKNSRQLRRAKRKIGAYIDDPYVDQLVGTIDTLEHDLSELRNAVTEHERYVKEKEQQALRDQIAAASIAFSSVSVYRF